jgi:putative NIF3 family GTP cyclohydrolase 1 type 2
MEPLRIIERDLDAFFGIEDSGVDPAFSRFLPDVYDGDERPWRLWFEPGFVARFNGLMIRGGDRVRTVFLSAFPSESVLHSFLDQSEPGDLLFVHHPIDLESGDPRGSWGRFFRPMAVDTIAAIQAKELSIYACHAPLDCHGTVSTSRSIAAALQGRVTGEFFAYGPGNAGVFAEIAPIALEDLEAILLGIFDVPYLDKTGARLKSIRSVAIVGGAGDRVDQMKLAEASGAQVYLTGEIHSRIDTDYGRSKFAAVERFAATSGMALLGVSHAASEFLVMRNEMRDWFATRYQVEATLLPEAHWWR